MFCYSCSTPTATWTSGEPVMLLSSGSEHTICLKKRMWYRWLVWGITNIHGLETKDTFLYNNQSCKMHVLWTFTLEKEGGKSKEHICARSCVDHSPPFNTNFSKLISSQLLSQYNIPRKDLHMLLQGWSHSAAGGSRSWEAAAARHLLSMAAQGSLAAERLVWLGSNLSWRGGRDPCVWVKEKKRVAAREIPSALQLLLGLLLSAHPSHWSGTGSCFSKIRILYLVWMYYS